jgi:tetratricopeptide (TPR) repeat protein
VALALLTGLASCEEPPVRTQEEIDRARPAEAVSLFGEMLTPPSIPADRRAELDARLADARQTYLNAPNDADAIIWLGRRTAYLNRFRDAIDLFALGIAKHPDDARMYRHRGHRYITTRRFGQAIADLTQAASLAAGRPDEIEPDGLPNARNVPTSTLQSNIWYHLGLAYYLEGEFAQARTAYASGMSAATTPDMRVAMAYWLYLTERRLGRDADAQALAASIAPDLDIIENHAYFRLLLAYAGGTPPDPLWDAAAEGLDRGTVGYGIGIWHFLQGDPVEAVRWWRQVLDASPWMAFGTIAAEAELVRLGEGRAGS